MPVELQKSSRPGGFQVSDNCRCPWVTGCGAIHCESIATKNLSQAIASLLRLARPAWSGNQLNRRVNEPTAVNRLPDRFDDSWSYRHGTGIIRVCPMQPIELRS